MSNTSFTLAYGCVLVAALLPMFCALLAKAGAMPRGGNRDPRAWLAAQSGWRARANAASILARFRSTSSFSNCSGGCSAVKSACLCSSF